MVKPRKALLNLRHGDVGVLGNYRNRQKPENAVAQVGQRAASVGQDDINVGVALQRPRQDDVGSGAGRGKGEVDNGRLNPECHVWWLDSWKAGRVEEDQGAIFVKARPDALEEWVTKEVVPVVGIDGNAMGQLLLLVQEINLGNGAVDVAPVWKGGEEAQTPLGRWVADLCVGLLAVEFIDIACKLTGLGAGAGNGRSRYG